MEILSHFRTIEELTKTLSREQGLLSEMFEKRKLMKFPLGVALELVGGNESVEQKLDSFSKWLDYLDFLKCYNQSFAAGYQFRKSHLVEQISLDIELKEKAGHLFRKYGVGSYLEIVNKLIQEMMGMGFAECISEQDETYKVTSAFHYAEELVNMIQIANEDETPE